METQETKERRSAKERKSAKARQIAQTIAEQIGGGKFRMMTGAEFYIYNEPEINEYGLSVHFKGSRKFNRLLIVLDEVKDLYKMVFSHQSPKRGLKNVHFIVDVYCDQLREIFESETGLYTSL